MGTPSGKASAAHRKAEAALRAFALELPETTEDFPWGHRTFKVKGKAFCFMTVDGDGLGLSVKLPESGGLALALPFTEPTGYGLGKAGWVSAHLRVSDLVPVELLREWLLESFRAVAPKKVLKVLDADEVPASTATAPRKRQVTARAARAGRRTRP